MNSLLQSFPCCASRHYSRSTNSHSHQQRLHRMVNQDKLSLYCQQRINLFIIVRMKQDMLARPITEKEIGKFMASIHPHFD